MSSPKENKLNRFTTLPVLLDLLIKKRLVFSDPKFWDDKNDTELLEIYRKRKKSEPSQSEPAKKLLALCFLRQHETIHHWKTFANGICGCCIEFDKAILTKLLSDHKSKYEYLRFGSVVYKKLKDVNDGAIDDCVDMLPFIKRWPYRFEKEFRVIWEGETDCHEIKIPDLSVITRITLSPIMPKPLFETIKKYLRSLGVPSETVINPSTIYENQKEWICKFKRKFGNNA
jgi:hypothetical protein